MPKFKLTKGELKKQRDALRQYERYLPTLQLKKQQLQLEILHQSAIAQERRQQLAAKKLTAQDWSGILAEAPQGMVHWLMPREVVISQKNIAGVDIPIFGQAVFDPAEYDLFLLPLWIDAGLDRLTEMASLREEIKVLEKGVGILRQELRITTQRVNLFEKVKIPEAEEAVRLIKIYIGDQMANAVGRSKIAKQKIEEYELEGAPA